MTYHLLRLVLGSQERVDLSQNEYMQIRAAVLNLFTALAIEEKLALVLDNYLDFEVELQQLTTEKLVRQDFEWGTFRQDTHRVNRRFANLLSAGRLYIDHVKTEVSALYGKESAIYTELEGSFRSEYDSHLGYRVLEALRNFVQHKSLPIYSLGYPSAADERAEPRLLSWGCTPSLSVSWIRTQGDFKAATLAELEVLGRDLIDLKPLVREYVSSIRRVHQQLRASMRNDIVTWEGTHQAAMTRWTQTFSTDVGLNVAARDERGVIVEKAAIFRTPIGHRQELERQHSQVIDFRKCYVSSVSEEDRTWRHQSR